MIYLDLEDVLHIAKRTLPAVELRDVGLLEAAVARPQASALGKDAYPSLSAKAAALLHSIARGQALVDSNKRLALAGVLAFYGVNGYRLTMTNEEAYDLVMSVATGELNDITAIADYLAAATLPRA